jgi:peptidoglycan hydrolase CwlO-like protein
MIFSFGMPRVSYSFDCVSDLRNTSSAQEKQFCQNELNLLMQEQANLEATLKVTQKETGTIKGDVAYLTSQINALKAKVKSRGVAIATLKVSISEKSSTIVNLSKKIESEKASLGQLLRNTNEADNQNFVHLVFSDETLSGFYSDMESYASIKQAIKKSVETITGVKVETEVQKADLQKKQDAETDAKAELEVAQKKVTQSETEKKKLLALNQKKESDYQKLLSEKKIKADKIRNALFSLAGSSKSIPFSEALAYANEAKGKTGIDPAFLLAILTQESNLGANVGKCYLTNPDTGAGIGVNTGKIFPNVMKPTRDVGPFLEVTKALGFDPYKSIVSCPIVSKTYWNSGSFGPAQFLPSTWKIFIPRLEALLGHYPNPWSPEDAFMASAIYLTDLGGIGESVSVQKRAACKYNGGGGASASCYYGKSVNALKNKIQADIDLLSY